MRKNTLIKLLAVLVMCLTIGAAFVACSEETANTSANDDVKVIISVAVDPDNNLVITYNDNTTSTVALPKEAECEHREDRQAYWPLAEHTAVANGTYLKVCHDCQDAWILYETRHQIVEKEVTVPATCTEAGYVTDKYCEICGHTENVIKELPALGHDLGEEVVEPNDGNSVCVSGATSTRECTRCDYVLVEDIPAADNEGFDGYHTITTWTTVVEPTLDAAGSAKGYCDVCGAEVTVELPALNTTDYNKVITKKVLNCGDEGEDTYTHKGTGLAYIVIRPAHDHGLVGLDGKHYELKSAVVDNPAASKWYSTADFPQIKEFVHDPINSCSKPVLAYYICEHINDDGKKCGGVVDIYAITGHDFTEDSVINADVPAECEKPGKDWKKCYACDEEKCFETEALVHEYEYKYSNYSDLTVDASGTFATYEGVCKNGCGKKDTQKTTSFTVEVTAENCEHDGKKVITWTAHDGVTPEPHIITLDKMLGHAILVNGEVIELARGNEGQKGDDKVVYYYDDIVDENGNHLLKNFQDEKFGAEPILGYFECYHKELHDGSSLVKVWVSTDEAYKANTPADLIEALAKDAE